jgi:uncharacterized protein (TIGR03435 family)
MRRRIAAAVTMCIVLVPRIAAAQGLSGNDQLVDPNLTFEVASVRPNELGAQSFLLGFRSGRFTARYMTVKELVRSAYRLTDSQVLGAPAWLDFERFDVLATAPGTRDSPRGIIPGEVLTMLRNLLEERFGLKARLETREFPQFALVLARQDGSLGRGLRRRTVPCTPRAVGELGELFGPRPSTRTQCGGRTDRGMLLSTGATIGDLVWALSRPELVPGVGRIVVDRTGLTGTFDIDLRWTPERPFTDGAQSAAALPSVDGNEPPLFTALQEQLGLKLERTKGPVDVLVIDHVERPTPNE